jgi:bifunctional DNA-binding transcriptional regulator/antitoxin component of YhaV-PrlF toxin-antitoxin module
MKRISQTYLSGGISCTVVIPIDLARKYHIDKPTNVTFEENDQGILIKRVEI